MFQNLKIKVEHKFGRKITYQKDCKILAGCILESTGQYISPSTLRRVFGFLPTNSNPARVTLNTLSKYCGFECWDTFQTNYKCAQSNSSSTNQQWEDGQKKALSISWSTCENLKRSIALGYNLTIPRRFAEERLTFFLKSNYCATAFIGPGGYGKSTLLVHWYNRIVARSEFKNDIILFLQASSLEASIAKHLQPDAWIQSVLSIDPPTLFDSLQKNPEHAPGRIIIIIDALDEISEQGSKAERIHQTIHKLIGQHSSHDRLKVVLSSRISTWRSFEAQGLARDQWFFVHNEVTSRDGVNMPPLNEDEIQQIFNNTINKENQAQLVVETLPNELLNAITYPYYLQLYIEVLRNDPSHHIADRLDLLTIFLKHQVFQSTYSEEKIDILDRIVCLMDEGKSTNPIRKNDLKATFPIHLKSEGNYYNAYNELLSFGIVTEENIENRFSSFTKCVRVSPGDLLELLIVQRLIEKNGGVSFNLFKIIENEYQGIILLPKLISLLFQITYKERNSTVLKSFFKLNPLTLSLVFEGTEIPTVLRNDDLMRHELIPHYAKDQKAQSFLFEKFIDVDNIVTSGKFIVQNYMYNSPNDKGLFSAKTLLILSAFLSLDTETVRQESNFLKPQTPNPDLEPLTAGLWFSCKILFETLIERRTDIDGVMGDLEEYLLMQGQQWNQTARLCFELGLSGGLIISRNHQELVSRVQTVLTCKPKEERTPVEKAITILFEYARWNLTRVFEPERMQEVEYYLNELPCGVSFHPSIIGRSFLSLYYLGQGNMEKAYEFFQKAIQVSTVSGYRICEVKLLKHLVATLYKIGETQKAQEYEQFARSLLNKTELPIEII